ncbi:MAG: porin, partial [Verrucomicrobiales bacterium]|nr:porin [Verrucomicrobiales bacterium]
MLTRRNHPLACTIAMASALPVLPLPTRAEEPPPVDPPAPSRASSFLDSLWDAPTLYQNDDHPFLKQFKFTGRYHGQFAAVDSDQGNSDEWENRRMRLGASARFFRDITFSAAVDIDDHFDPSYKNLDTASFTAPLTDFLSIELGKHKPRWSHEASTSSKRLLTIERSLLVNQVRPLEATGFSASGSHGHWSYQAGVFSGNVDDEFGDLSGGSLFLLSLGYEFPAFLGLGPAPWRLDYLHTDPEPGDSAAAPYEHAFATSLTVGKDRLHCIGELIFASGMSPDAYGINLIPYYDITEKLQVVTRYQYATSDNNGLRLQKRYERAAPLLTDGGRGDRYHAFYTGLNYQLRGHKLKLMAGTEWATMDGGGDGG